MYFVESMNINLKYFRYMSKSTGIYRDTESLILRTSYVPICKNNNAPFIIHFYVYSTGTYNVTKFVLLALHLQQ